MSINTDELHQSAIAVGVQSAFGTINATIRDLTGAGLTSLDGFILGDAESGDAEDGIVSPNLVPLFRDRGNVGVSFTERADSFQRLLVEGLTLSYAARGNGATATDPLAVGEAELETPLPGMHAILLAAGLTDTDGAAPKVTYTPDATGTTTYLTIKKWIGDLSFVYQDCAVETLVMAFTPGGQRIDTVSFKVGSLAVFADGVTFPPAIDYGVQASLAAPLVVGVNFDWGETRGFQDLSITITNEFEDLPDSNVALTGMRFAQARRIITVDGTIFVETTDSEFAYQQTILTVDPTEDLTFQVGTPAIALATMNAFLLACNNLQSRGIKYNKAGNSMIVELNGAKCTAPTVGVEFAIEMN